MRRIGEYEIWMARSQFLVVTNYIRKTIIYKLSFSLSLFSLSLSLSLSFRVNLSKYLYKTTRTRTRGFGFGFFFDSTQKINKYLFLLLFSSTYNLLYLLFMLIIHLIFHLIWYLHCRSSLFYSTIQFSAISSLFVCYLQP